MDLKVRPVFHHQPERVKAHIFLCMLSYYVEWHMRRALAPLLFDDEDRSAAQAERRSIVAAAQRSQSARRKAATRQTEDGFPVHSFRTLLEDLATLTRNRVRFGTQELTLLAEPTRLQQRAFELLQIKP